MTRIPTVKLPAIGLWKLIMTCLFRLRLEATSPPLSGARGVNDIDLSAQFAARPGGGPNAPP